MDQKSFLVSRFNKFSRRDRAVKANQIEAVFFCLPNILDGGFLQRAPCHVRMVVGDNATDVAAKIAWRPVQKQRRIR